MKKCFKCQVEKELGEFYTNKAAKGGLHNQCKDCLKSGVSIWRKANPEKTKGYQRKFKLTHPDRVLADRKRYYENNKEKVLEYGAKWYAENREKALATRHAWTDRNPDYYTITGRIRRHHISKNCKPSWVDETHSKTIKELYSVARKLTKLREEPFHVDHIEPLKGVNNQGEHVSSGLHVWWNLRVIPAIENLKKSNKLKQ